MTNQYETLARYRKAHRIADAIRRLEIFTPDDTTNLPLVARRSIEVFAEVRPASEATWVLVPEILRNWAATTADPFAGLR